MDVVSRRSHQPSRGTPLILFAVLTLLLGLLSGVAGAQPPDAPSIDPIDADTGDLLISQTDGVLWVYRVDTGDLEDHPLPFGGIWDIQWDSGYSILIANSAAGRIWHLDLATGEFELVAEGDPLGFPIGLALDPNNNDVLWVADHNAGVLRLDRSSGDVEVVVPYFGGAPDGIAVDDDGTVYFTDQSDIVYKVDTAAPGNYDVVAVVGGYGLNGLVFDDAGALLATATWPSAVAEIDVATGVSTVYDYSAQMRSSEDTAVDSEGNWWIIDSGFVFQFGDDPGLYRVDVPGVDFTELHRGEPLGDTVDLLVVPPRGIEVAIDIKPGSYPNSININGHGVIPVAVLGSESFDVTQVDTTTLDFAGLEVKANKKGKVQCAFDDVSGDFTTPAGAPDGYVDLVCQFVDDANRWSPDDGTATLSGLLLPEYGAGAFFGSDSFRQVPVGKPSTPLVIWVHESSESGLTDAAAAFTADTGIDVVLEVFEEFDLRGPLNEAAAGDTGPDLFLGAHDWTGELAEAGLIEPIELGPVASEFAPVALQALRYEGQQWALPVFVEAIAMFYNADLVGAPPSTFEGLGPSCDAMVGIANCVGLQTSDAYHHYPFLTAFDGYVFGYDAGSGYDPTDVGLDSPGAIAGAEFLEDQVQAGVIGDTGGYGETLDLFVAGVQPYWLTGPWNVGTANDAGMNWGVVPIPTMGGNVPGPFVGVHGFFLGAYGQQDAATDFLLDYVATTETMIDLFEEAYRPPAHLGAYAAVADDVTEAFMTSAAAGEPMPNIPEMGVVWGPLMDAFDAIRTGTVPAADAMEWAADEVRNALGG